MKYSLLILLCLLGCDQGGEVTRIEPASNCTVVKVGNIATISCSDGSHTTISDGVIGSPGLNGNNGNDGSQGPSGQNGSNGHSALINSVSIIPPLCGSGGGVTINMGIDMNDNMFLDNAEITNVAILCNGQNASMTPFTPVDVINPCGDSPNRLDEVLLRLNNGMILASFSDSSNGNNTRFGIIPAGNYVTTDGDKCYFNVDNQGNVINEHH